MGDSDILVKVDGVRKKFSRSLKKSLWYGVKDMVAEVMPFGRKAEMLKTEKLKPANPDASVSDVQKVSAGQPVSRSAFEKGLRPGEFWAVKDVSFELKRGECIGLIGHNGAGKTTLLKILNGLIKPDHGRIEMHGRVGALIALGAGFNPILTGRENIYVNGSVLGLSKREINGKIEDIIEFAGIRDFIDTPVQSYSSGMQVRLGFAVATALEPDILILDEVLAVGDANFRTKCFVRILSLLSRAAVIFVSHSEEQLTRICTTGLLLERGAVLCAGPLKRCLEVYRERQPAGAANWIACHGETVRQAEIKLAAGRHVSGEDFHFEVRYHLDRPVELSLHVVAIIDEAGAGVAACDLLPNCKNLLQGPNTRRFTIKALSLRPGRYTMQLEALSAPHGAIIARKRFKDFLTVTGSVSYWCSYTPTVEAAN